MKKIDIPTKDSFLLEINTYYPQEIDGSRLIKSCKRIRFDDINSLIKYKHRAEAYDPNVRCRVYLDITDKKTQLSMDL